MVMCLRVSRSLFNTWLYVVLHLHSLSLSLSLESNPPQTAIAHYPNTCALTFVSTLSLSPLQPGSVSQQVSLPVIHPTMPSSTSTYSFTHTLIDSPRLNHPAWLAEALQHARHIYPKLDVHGALYLVCSDAQWKKLAKNIITVDDGLGNPNSIVTTYRPRPIHVEPPTPRNNDSKPVRSFYLVTRPLYDAAQEAEAALTEALLASIGTSNTAVLRKAGVDLMDITAMQIMDGMKKAHGWSTPHDAFVLVFKIRGSCK